MSDLDYTQMDNRSLLLLVAEKVSDLDDTINGSGRPGLVERVTTLEANTPSKKERWGVIGAVLTGVVAGAARLLGVETPI